MVGSHMGIYMVILAILKLMLGKVLCTFLSNFMHLFFLTGFKCDLKAE